jgi:hypothetical protein
MAKSYFKKQVHVDSTYPTSETAFVKEPLYART